MSVLIIYPSLRGEFWRRQREMVEDKSALKGKKDRNISWWMRDVYSWFLILQLSWGLTYPHSYERPCCTILKCLLLLLFQSTRIYFEFMLFFLFIDVFPSRLEVPWGRGSVFHTVTILVLRCFANNIHIKFFIESMYIFRKKKTTREKALETYRSGWYTGPATYLFLPSFFGYVPWIERLISSCIGQINGNIYSTV